MSSTVRVLTPAKVNLLLGVGQRRADGFHELCNVFHAVDLVDEVGAASSTGLSLETSVADPLVPTGPGNLAWQAAQLLADAAGRAPDVALTLTKAIPVAGGMAGGSADAAGALVACRALWDVDADLMPLAERLGSDVPFALLGDTAVGTGRGEVLTPVTTAGELHWVFAVAGFGIATAMAYRRLDELRTAGTAPEPVGAPGALFAALTADDVERVGAALGNDLQAAALDIAPVLRDTLAAGGQHGAVAGLVSGSGPTCAFLCSGAAQAGALATALLADGACQDAVVACGPHPGARVVGDPAVPRW